MDRLFANRDKTFTMLSLVDHADLSCTLLSSSISKKDSGEHVATTEWQCIGSHGNPADEFFIHSDTETKSKFTMLHTFCPSPRLAGERHLKRTLMPRVHPEKCTPVELLAFEENQVHQDPAVGTESDGVDSARVEVAPALNSEAFESVQPSASLDHVIPITNTFARSRLGRKRKQPDAKKSESHLFSDALSDYMYNFDHLSSPNGTKSIRVVHFYSENRCFAYASAHCKFKIGEDRQSFPVISVIWQTNERPKRAIAVTFSLEPSNEDLRAACTCKPIRSVGILEDSSCEHVKVCLTDVGFLQKVESALKAQKKSISEYGRSTELFGDPIPIESNSLQMKFPAACLTRENVHFQGRRTNVEKKKKDIRRSWAFWIVFDSQSFAFVPVLKLEKKPYLCLLCRLDSGSRGMCNHELTCFMFGKGTEETNSDVELEEESTPEHRESPNCDQQLSTSDLPYFGSEVRSGEMSRTLYVTNNMRRSILPCSSEIKMTEHIAGIIEDLQPSTALYMHESNLASCKKCHSRHISKPNWTLKRKMNLFTLSQGTVHAVVCDWYCQQCGEKNLFSGTYHGVFPARKESCYTVELMYAWSQLVCFHGFSFREAYRTTRLTSGAVSNTSRFRKRGSTNYDRELQPARKRANEAFREFLKTMKTDCSSFNELNFSCSRCEVPLTADDCAQLNIDQQLAADLKLKRFKAIVIDGTAAGILKKLPNYTRDFETLTATRLRNAKVVPTAQHQKVIQSLLQMCAESLRTLRKKKSSLFEFSASTTNLEFWLHNPLETHKSIVSAKSDMTLAQAQAAMMMCEENACFCERNNETHSEECDKLKTDFERPTQVVIDVLSSVFSVRFGTPPLHSGGEDQPASEQQEHHSRNETHRRIQENSSQPFSQDQQIRSEETLDNQATSGQFRNSSNGRQPIQASSRVSTSAKSVWASIRIPDVERYGDFVEALIALIRFTTSENVTMPYMTRISQNLAGLDDVPISRLATIYSNRSQSLPSMTSSSINLHKRVVQSLRLYCSCERHREQHNVLPWDECSCVDEVKKWASLLQEANPILETFCIQLTKLRREENSLVQNAVTNIVRAMCKLLDVQMAMAISYLRKLDVKLPKPSKGYWSSGAFTDVVTQSSEVDDEFNWYETGMCFPGRSRCRPGIIFEEKETQHCNKKYPKSETHSPGLLTVQCACENPKLIGFIVMTRAESTALALSAILMYFPLPPRTVYYDNACNLFASIFLRLPWLLNCTRVAVDRFHYKSHTCSAFFCPDSYQALDEECTETAESFNARIEKSLYHMQFLGPENLVPFLYNRLAQLNVSALFKEKFKRSDLEDEDLPAFLRSMYKCTCELCGANTESIPETMTGPSLLLMNLGSHSSGEQNEDTKEENPEAPTQENPTTSMPEISESTVKAFAGISAQKRPESQKRKGLEDPLQKNQETRVKPTKKSTSTEKSASRRNSSSDSDENDKNLVDETELPVVEEPTTPFSP